MEKLIIIGGSAGSFKIVNHILENLPVTYKHTVVLCLHRLRSVRAGFAEALQINSSLKISEPSDKEIIRGGQVYLAPSNYHLMFEQGLRFSLSVSEPVNHSRPSIDICIDTAADIFRETAVGIILSGANMDGAKGMYKLKKAGGLTIVQDPGDSEIGTMPEACISLFQPDHIMNASKIISFISNL